MRKPPPTPVLDQFARSRLAILLAFAWGLAEATFFFIVPDVLLTLIACRALRPALKASAITLAGALMGGALMCAFGSSDPGAARTFLDAVPAISPELLARVESQVNSSGLWAVLLGPIEGIPYKIYAVEWGARDGSLLGFMLISVPARYVRFCLASLVARGIARLVAPVTGGRASLEIVLLALIWIGFYTYYFAKFSG